jgi:hypothetical protein
VKKCAFWLSKMSFLGHVINQHGISIDTKNVATVVKWMRHSNVIVIHNLLGLASYY